MGKDFVDETPVARKRRQESAQNVVERHIVVAGNAKHFVAGMLEPFEEPARIAELLGAGALREIAADDDEVGLQLVDPFLDSFNQPLVMGAEMQVREMD